MKKVLVSLRQLTREILQIFPPLLLAERRHPAPGLCLTVCRPQPAAEQYNESEDNLFSHENLPLYSVNVEFVALMSGKAEKPANARRHPPAPSDYLNLTSSVSAVGCMPLVGRRPLFIDSYGKVRPSAEADVVNQFDLFVRRVLAKDMLFVERFLVHAEDHFTVEFRPVYAAIIQNEVTRFKAQVGTLTVTQFGWEYETTT